MPHIQQREIPQDRFGRLVEFDGQSDSPADVQQFLQEHGYIVFRQGLDRASIMSARKEVLSRLNEVGEIAEPVIEGRATGQSRRPDPTEDRGKFWKSVNCGHALREVTHGRPTYDIVAKVFGEAARGHDLMYLRPMPPGGVTPLHYDYPFFAGDSLRIHTVWIPIGDVPLCDGPLVIVENSFQFNDLLDAIRAIDFSDNRSNDAVQAAAYDAPNALHPIDLAEQRSVRLLSTDFEAGDVVVFSGFTLHGSLDNNRTDLCSARSIGCSAFGAS
jgi:ectoine hydroxylase-related dioxygenase (phytanoyl-CoA dioxygenase family)